MDSDSKGSLNNSRRDFLILLLSVFCLSILLNGCANRRISPFSNQIQWYSSNYPGQKNKKEEAPEKQQETADISLSDLEPAADSNSEIELKPDEPQKEIKTEVAPIPKIQTVKKEVQPWQISGKIRKADKLFIGYTRWSLQDNRYFYNIKRAGMYLKYDTALMYEYGFDKDAPLPGYSVKNTNLELTRTGFVIRKYFGNSFYALIATHEIDLSGTLSFYDSDFGGTNEAYLTSSTRTMTFGIGNEWFLNNHWTIGFDWLALQSVLSREYHFGFDNSGETVTAIDFKETFTTDDPVGSQARLWGSFILNVGWMF
ncbi:MAG: hypothetical protein HN580_10055 [Deltaproteobacteria bacterium]|jgi:hypothetical protein|nr:hypothetical protein [Deltaproteobacteria bacterium]MBT4264133.1 hypothetical protein [Deltaproteobacteria bacterium]MBT4644809.1 hypothetical protein [Deltaproteobacteria bacterium]MBT6501347.1 hypothetical protein [Deltaproteobacteria bacterium]MBT6612865.1 hypothetical protein [Deltaproteobacteria bacterium]